VNLNLSISAIFEPVVGKNPSLKIWWINLSLKISLGLSFSLRISVLFVCFHHYKSMQELQWIKRKFILKNKF